MAEPYFFQTPKTAPKTWPRGIPWPSKQGIALQPGHGAWGSVLLGPHLAVLQIHYVTLASRL